MPLKPITRDADADAIQIIEPLCAVFRRHLKAIGQKYTPERAQVLDTLFRLDDLFEAEQLQAALKREGRRVSKATIYRTIKLLQDAGIIQKVFVDSDQAHFQLAYGRKPHELLLRMDTKEIIQVDLPELAAIRDQLCRERGLRATGHRLIIYATRA